MSCVVLYLSIVDNLDGHQLGVYSSSDQNGCNLVDHFCLIDQLCKLFYFEDSPLMDTVLLNHDRNETSGVQASYSYFRYHV